MRGRIVVLALALALCTLLALSSRAEADSKDRIIRIGKSYLGTPHAELNCSEYTRLVYGRATGVWMPAWDDKQRFYGYEPRKRKRGDLMLFKERSGDGPITHVGIALSHGRILHSSVFYGHVLISEARYIEGYKGVRRIR